MTDEVPRGALRFYRVLLRAYPRELRDDVGGEMLALFRDRWRDERRRGGRAALALLVLRTLLDVARNAPAEWLAPPAERHTMDAFLQDLRYALRSLVRRPGFLVVAVLTLAIGIGANAAIFSVMDAVILRPLPYPNPDQLVFVSTATPTTPQAAVSYPDLVDWRHENRTFSALAGWRGQSVNLTGDGNPERVTGAFITSEFFSILGAQPLLGRAFRPEECDPATAGRVAIVSYGLWERRFGADPALLGKTLILNGVGHTVVGIMGQDFGPEHGPTNGYFHSSGVWLPMASFPNAAGLTRAASEVLVVGRLKAGVTVAQGQDDLASVAAALAERYPEQRGRTVRLESLSDALRGPARPPIFVLFGGVALVLLIACVNVASLVLARGSQRERELALRAALGASRRRLARQLFTESLVLALLGGFAGLLTSVWLLKAILALVPWSFMLPTDIAISPSVWLYTLGVAGATALVFGLAPALQASRTDVNGVLKGTSGTGRRQRVRDVLIVAEGALSLVLLVGAGLLARTAMTLADASPGFRTDHLLTFELRLPPSRYDSAPRIATFFREMKAAIEAVPGVERVALARAVPYGGNTGRGSYVVAGRAPPPAGQETPAQTNLLSPGWFATLGIPLLAGRDFSAADTADSPPVVVVNATLAEREWPGESALGKHLILTDTKLDYTVIGVVGDVRHATLTEEPLAQIYGAHEQLPKIFTGVVVRTSGPPSPMVAAVRQAVWSVDKDQPMWKFASMTDLLAGDRRPAQALALLMIVVAGVAVLLSGVGLYGVMSSSVARRTREIGIRMALGAHATRVIREVVLRALTLSGIACVLGLGGAWALRKVLAGLLFGVGPFDPVVLASAAAVLFVVSLAAAYLPARRAARVDPTIALASDA